VEKTRQWERIKELFEAALQREPSERAGFLRYACGDDSSLRAEVESLLSAHAQSDALSESPLPSDLLQGAEPSKFIGPYRLIEKLGEGGMGQVWLAEQTEPLHRQVALKLIRAGMYDDALLHRFQSERQSLALMDHPAIAKVFDAGATPDGQPYFVMEYVPGEPITEYCDRKKLSIQARLQLFIKACEGVQHAHQKAIIHRDLKPANILVVEIDGKPTPRIIDFGLAKAATPLAAGETLFTQTGAFVGTPGYMSPEQADPGVQDVDTRSDVYSLGVVLYVLLTGFQPIDTKRWNLQPLHEALRQLREQDPPRPSAKVEMEKESSTSAAEFRGTEPRHLASQLHGDLDWITMRSLEKERARRYGTPSELAADIERYLNHEPVVARPASAGYQLQKYVRRHRVSVIVAAALTILLATFAAVQAVQLRRITRERDRANRITDFMTGMFKVSDPSEARGNSITAREILDKASTEIDPGLAKDPELQAQMMYVMGKVYDSLGLFAVSESLLQRAYDTRRRVLGPENPDTLNSMIALAWTLRHEGRYADAEKLQRETLEIRTRVLGPEHPETIASMGNLAVTLDDEGHYADAEKLQRQVLDFRRRILGLKNPDTVFSMNNLALDLQMEGRYPEAEKLDRDAIEIRRDILGPDHPDVLRTMHNLANVLYREGRYADAEKLDRETIDEERRVLGPENPFTMMAVNSLTAILNGEGRYAEAADLGRQVLDIRRRTLGPEHPQTLTSMSNLADTLTKLGNYDEAEKLLTQARDIQRRVLGPDHPNTAMSVYNLACLAARQGHRDEALSQLRQALDHGLASWIAKGMEKDPDLASLRNDPRFQSLVALARERSAQKAN
jgi:non-specific serine/threonine protein kinase/serine/threonine-protein kinase